MDDLWLDAVLAVPAVGIQMRVPPSVAVRAREVIGPALDELAALSDLQISRAVGDSGSEIRIVGADGFTHKLVQHETGMHATIEFAFATVEKKAAGQLPDLKYEVRTYSLLVKDAVRRVEILTSPLLRQSGVHPMRMGLAATAELASAQLPPGFTHYREWSERPWTKRGGSVTKLQTTILVRLTSVEGQHDQCHHGLGYEHRENEDTEYRLMLDYQRVFTKAPSRALEWKAFVDKATSYFQRFSFPEERSWE